VDIRHIETLLNGVTKQNRSPNRRKLLIVQILQFQLRPAEMNCKRLIIPSVQIGRPPAKRGVTDPITIQRLLVQLDASDMTQRDFARQATA
jgi:hypothetical protein